MKLDHVIKVLFLIVIIMVVVTSAYTYRVYNNLCNNEQNYKAVELIQSDQAYDLCGENFGIVNTGDNPITVTKFKVDSDEVTSEAIANSASEVESTKLASGDTLAIEASNDVVYQISNPLGSNLDHSIQVRKF